jgi:IPT/TIG domain
MASVARSPSLAALAITLTVTVLSCGTCPPVPSITSLSPASATAGGGQFLLTVNGDDFRHDSLVSWNGSFRVTAFVSSHELVATITATDIGTVRLGAGFRVQSPGGRHDFCLRWDRSDAHYLVQRQELQCRSLHGQPVIVASATASSKLQSVIEKFREKYGASVASDAGIKPHR